LVRKQKDIGVDSVITDRILHMKKSVCLEKMPALVRPSLPLTTPAQTT
jgi:hypothetical protein